MFDDEPLRDPASDRLSRGAYAERVAEVLVQVSKRPASVVVGIVGPWGSGKTTLLNFVLDRLKTNQQMRIVEFNPWILPDLPSLVADFLATLLSALPTGDRESACAALAPYVRAAAPFAGIIRIPGIDAAKAVGVMADRLEADTSLSEKKRQVETVLKKLDEPVLVVLDDIDRLHAEELMMVFKLVRLVGRLPNVYYLLAYDETTVLDVITQTGLAADDLSRARRYLEKMVQVRLDVPPMPEVSRRNLMAGLLNEIRGRYGVELRPTDQQRLRIFYEEHLRHSLREPRQVKRYGGQIEAHYPSVQAEVDFVDFALLSYLRMSHPAVVNMLPIHKSELTGTDFKIGQPPDLDEQAERWRERLTMEGIAENELDRVLDVLGQLFHPITEVIGRTGHSGYANKYDEGKRAGSVEYFDRYFHLGFGPDDIPDSAVEQALQEVLGDGPGPSWSHMVDFLAINATPVVRKLRRLVRDEDRAAEKLLPFLCDLAGHVPPALDWLDRTEVVFNRMVAELLTEVTPDSAYSFVHKLACRSSVRFVGSQTAWAKTLLTEDGRTPSTAFNEVCAVVADLIATELDRQATLHPRETDGIPILLTRWGTLDPSAPRKEWLLEQLGETGIWAPSDFAALLVPVNTVFTSAAPDSQQELGGFDFELIEEIIGVECLTTLIGDPATNPEYQVEEPTSDDTSFEARRARALQALVYRASNSSD